MRAHYQVVVTGGRLSALLAAALLAKRGLKTLVVDQAELDDGVEGGLWDLVPSAEDSEAIRAIHTELMLDEAIRSRTVPLTPAVQAIFVDGRVELRGPLESLAGELERELSAKPQAVQSTTKRIQEAEREVGGILARAKPHGPRGLFSRGPFSGAIARTKTGLSTTVEAAGLLADAPPALTNLLVSALPFLTHLDSRVPDDATVGRFARPVMRFLRGFRTTTDGCGLRSLVVDMAARDALTVERALIERIEPLARSVRVRIRGKDELVTADAVLDASTTLSAVETIPGARNKRELGLALQAATPAGFLHTIGIEVDRRVIPPPMSSQVILLSGEAGLRSAKDASPPSSEARAIWISRRPGSSEGRERLLVSHPVNRPAPSADELSRLTERMRHLAGCLIPFLEQGDPEVRSLTAVTPHPEQPAAIPIHPLYDPRLDATEGFGGVPTRTSYRNVFLAGPAVLPGLGVEGAYRGALLAADAISRTLRG